MQVRYFISSKKMLLFSSVKFSCPVALKFRQNCLRKISHLYHKARRPSKQSIVVLSDKRKILLVTPGLIQTTPNSYLSVS